VTADAYRRGADRIAHLAKQGLDVAAFWRQSGEVLHGTVPHYLAPCWFTFDPVSLLVTSHYDPVIPAISADFLAHEYGGDDVLKMADVARSKTGTATIHEATAGNPSSSEGWRKFVQAYGAEQQLQVALRSRTGVAWGLLALYREPRQPPFSPAELAFLGSISRSLAEGARRGLLIGDAQDPEEPGAPCLIVLDENWTVRSMTAGTETLLAALPGDRDRGALPACVLAVAGRALRGSDNPRGPGEVAVARVRGDDGRWLTVHGAPLLQDAGRRVAVIIEQTDPDRLASLLMDVYELTDREKEISQLVLRGNSTAEIASRLYVSEQTVQQHLKNIFDKTGVHSRRELVSKVFFAHYEPRLRDNEQRAQRGQPIRRGLFGRGAFGRA
jgi:DNA-binding CsgD family transcriptional regulator